MKIDFLKIRIIAFVFDMVLFTIISSFFDFNIDSKETTFYGIKFRLWVEVYFLEILTYFLFFDLVNNGRTLGKLIFKIKIVSNSNSNLSLSNRLLRTFFKTATISTLILSFVILYRKLVFYDQYLNCKTVCLEPK
ncbi:RDD family protein [Flavobacterium sp. SUN046]|uniref:RDD family protein n=1 Tax=Flavobacterium sp. SUN046 TaxID=3002440 RepID=UPI002DB6D2BC|nr:RDD family protein [Flavobacterium sp. SUN046]MEC4048435.1 RDD family protein [Flavobacterium sp. SUN046]